MFNTARFLGVFTTIYSIVLGLRSLLKDRLNLIKIRRMRQHTILCGLGEIGNAIFHNFEDKRKLLIIEKNPDNENIEHLRSHGAKIIEANALDPEVFKKIALKNASCFYALTGDDFNNLTIINHVKSILKDCPGRNPRMRLAANIDSLNLKIAKNKEMLLWADVPLGFLASNLKLLHDTAMNINKNPKNDHAALNEKMFRIRMELLDYVPGADVKNPFDDLAPNLFNINELTAKYLFRLYPPDRFRPILKPTDTPLHILFIGFSQMCDELFKLCVQNCHYISEGKTRISLLHLDAGTMDMYIEAKLKRIKDLFDIKFIDQNPLHLTPRKIAEETLSDVDVIYICSEHDSLQTSYSVKAREVFRETVPIIRWFSKDNLSGTPNQIKGYNYTLGIFKEVANHENIINEALDRKAIAVHNHWLSRAIPDYIKKVDGILHTELPVPQLKPTMVSWDQLNEEFRDDNRSVIEHNLIKIRSTGQLTKPADFENHDNQEVNFDFLQNDLFVEKLAKMEHHRWMATKYLYSWEYNAVRNDLNKHNNNLVAFEALDIATRNDIIKQIRELPVIWNLK